MIKALPATGLLMSGFALPGYLLSLSLSLSLFLSLSLIHRTEHDVYPSPFAPRVF